MLLEEGDPCNKSCPVYGSMAAHDPRGRGAHDHLLDDPEAAPVWPLDELLEGQPAALAEVVGLGAETSRDLAPAPGAAEGREVADEPEGRVAPERLLAQPRDNAPGASVDTPHPPELPRALVQVILVDAHGVDPQLEAVLELALPDEGPQDPHEADGDSHRPPVHNDGSRVAVVSPGV